MRERATVFSLRLDPESRAVVKQEAMRQRVTESTIIRKAIERYVYWCIQERTAGRLP
jgi:predicted transcriptional regulator